MNTQIETLARGAAIIEGNQEKFRKDGYTNLLNKYGTGQDNSTAYQYADVPYIADSTLSELYVSNGLFAKIIDRPAEEAVKHGLDIDFGSEEISGYVDECLDELDFEDKIGTAEKWSRLFGGSLVVMLIDDGRGLEEPVDIKRVKSIRELKVYERAVVQPDYYTKTDYKNRHQISEPEFFNVSSRFEQFRVHASRCLVFRNGRLPEFSMNEIYRYWGVPEYIRTKNELRECVTAHGNGTRLLERSVQAIYKMKNLATLLATDDGENKVLQRLQVIDMARGILNSIAIDTDGEDYDYKNFSLSGIKDVIDSTCNMLSAVTNIPQTILFGRSPAGMNSTGESDMENFYNMVENIQKRNIKANTRRIIDYILMQGLHEGVIQEIPTFKMKFAELWSMSAEEKANVEKIKADTEHIKAQTTQAYLDSGVIDVSEVRKKLADEGIIEAELNEADMPFSEIFEEEIEPETQVEKPTDEEITTDEAEIRAAAVIIIKDGKILASIRKDNFTFCGAGGKVEAGETTEAAAIREAKEEFNIVPHNLIPLGALKDTTGDFMDTMVYFTTDYSGTPQADGSEMEGVFWFSLDELSELPLFPPFAKSLEMLKNTLTSADNFNTINVDGGAGSGNWGHGGRKGKVGGSTKGGGVKHRLETPSGGFASRAEAERENKRRSKEISSSKKEKKQPTSSKVEHKSFEQMNKEYMPSDKEIYKAMLKAQGKTFKNKKEEIKAIERISQKSVQKELAKEFGSMEEWREKNLETFIKQEKEKLETIMNHFVDGSLSSVEYEKRVVRPMDREYKKSVTTYTDYDNDIKPNEFYNYQKESMKNMTVEDFAILQNSYYHGAKSYDSNYVDYTKRKINGEELNWSQKRLEQIVSEHSVEIKERSTFFRKTSEEEFIALTGKTLSDFNNSAPEHERTSTISKCTSFGTALQQNGFLTQNVIIEYTTKKGAKAFFTTNTDELEGILPVGTKISNIKVNGKTGKNIPSIERKERITEDVKGVCKANYSNPNGVRDGWYDYSYSGLGLYNKNMRQRGLAYYGVDNPINDCIRVTVEVE